MDVMVQVNTHHFSKGARQALGDPQVQRALAGVEQFDDDVGQRRQVVDRLDHLIQVDHNSTSLPSLVSTRTSPVSM